MEYPYIYRDLPDEPGNSRDTTLKFATTGTLLFSIHSHNQPATKTPISRLKGNSSKQ